MIRSKADSTGAAGHATSIDERNATSVGDTATAAGKRGNAPQMLMDWTRSNPVAGGSNASEKEEGKIIRSSSVGEERLDQQLVDRLLMASSSSASVRNLTEFLVSGGKGFSLFSPAGAYGGNWNQQQQIKMDTMIR